MVHATDQLQSFWPYSSNTPYPSNNPVPHPQHFGCFADSMVHCSWSKPLWGKFKELLTPVYTHCRLLVEYVPVYVFVSTIVYLIINDKSQTV